MTTTTPALIADSATSGFRQGRIERRDLRPDDIRIGIAYAGICHSDIHTVREEWGPAHFPLTVGHEIAGTVLEVGDEVTRHAVGDRVGVGCLVDSCGECGPCKDGMEMFCTKPSVGTYNAQGYDGEWTMGGYSQEVVVSERFVLRIPDALGLDVAAPLLCAGITTYSPLRRWGAGTGRSVAVVGVGGLGHMGVKIAAAMGATRDDDLAQSMAKADDAVALGATAHIASSDAEAMKAARGTFDIVLNTVSADIPITDYVRLLKPSGVVVNVGLPPAALLHPARLAHRRQQGRRRLADRRHRRDPGDARLLRRARHRRDRRGRRRRRRRPGLGPGRRRRRALPRGHRHEHHHRGLTRERTPVSPA